MYINNFFIKGVDLWFFDKKDYKAYDADLWNAIAKEEERQQNNIELIASENVVSKGSDGCSRVYSDK